MSSKQPPSRRSVLNFLGLGVLVLLAFGVIHLSRGSQAPTEPVETASLPDSAPELSSPLTAAMSSPVPAALRSPLAATRTVPESGLPPAVAPPQSPLMPAASTALAPPDAVPSADIEITVLHTNDTWGYLLPCG